MNRFSEGHSISGLFSFLLFLLFTACALLLIISGSKVYQNSLSHMEENFSSRTAIAYVTEKLRAYDTRGAISLTTVEEIPALCLRETTEEGEFSTYLYYYEGALRELFLRSSSAPSAQLGTAIVSLQSFSFTIEEGLPDLIRLSACSGQGNVLESMVHLEAGL